jgi:hypothetical protein
MRIMNGRARNIAAGWAFMLVVLTAATPSLAQAPTPSIKDQLVGSWQLESITINNIVPYGANPQGSMIFTADGHYSVIVLSNGGARNISYFGTYTVDAAGNTVTMHIGGSTRAKADGRDQKRVVTLSGDELIVANPPSSGRGSIKLTWKRSS